MSKKILIVDDDELVLIALKELLKAEHYEVRTCSRGAEALTTIDQEDFDLLILDIIMPEMDGFELCREIRKKIPYQEKPIIFLTAKNQEEDKKRGLEAGGTLFLSKPISPQRLLALLADAVA
jgi:DNA-binding response OmpR family regulator